MKVMKVLKLNDICKIGSSKRIHLSDYVENGVPFYRSKEIIELSEGNLISEPLFISRQKFNEIKHKFPVPKANDILITSVGTLGVVHLVKDPNFYFKDGNLTWLREFNEKIIDIDFLFYWLNSNSFKKQILNNNIGAVQKAITIDFLKKVDISLPDISNQQSIAAVLSALDKKIALNKQINTRLEQMAKTLYDYWFVQFDFPDADGRPYKSSGGEMIFDETLKREIPKGWEVKSLGDLAEIVSGSTPSTADSDNFCSNGTAWITPYDLSKNQDNKFISHGEIDVSEKGIKNASLKKYPAGTVLMSSRAPIGYMAIARNEVTTNQGFKSFIPNKGFSKEFVFYAVKNSLKSIMQSASGSTFKEVSAATLHSIQLIFPKYELVDAYTDRSKEIFKLQDNLEKQNRHLTQLRNFLLPMLMNGQVSVACSGAKDG
ncbi:restriction endonuclease subunit S [Moraxella marmotae]|uniref:restriction endonuclease subunit S n=1 Tax=Moraxella marmotae TaxID=3344520 RepID=UPI0035F3A177